MYPYVDKLQIATDRINRYSDRAPIFQRDLPIKNNDLEFKNMAKFVIVSKKAFKNARAHQNRYKY